MRRRTCRADHNAAHSDLVDATVRYLNLLLGSFAHKTSNVVARFEDPANPGKAIVRSFGQKGAGDVLWFYRGRGLVLECKTGKGQLSPDQRKYRDNVERAGCRFMVIRSVEQLVAEVRIVQAEDMSAPSPLRPEP